MDELATTNFKMRIDPTPGVSLLLEPFGEVVSLDRRRVLDVVVEQGAELDMAVEPGWLTLFPSAKMTISLAEAQSD